VFSVWVWAGEYRGEYRDSLAERYLSKVSSVWDLCYITVQNDRFMRG